MIEYLSNREIFRKNQIQEIINEEQRDSGVIKEEIRAHLGDPIYFRFDGFIPFSELDNESLIKIIDIYYSKKKTIGHLKQMQLFVPINNLSWEKYLLFEEQVKSAHIEYMK